MAKAYFFRVDSLLTNCTKSQMKNDGYNWYQSIMGLYKEIYPKMTTKERENAAILRDNLNALHKEFLRGKPVKPEYYFAFELYLRQLLEDKKMLTPKGDDPSMAYRGSR